MSNSKELVIGLIGSVGTNLELAVQLVKNKIKNEKNYNFVKIRLSELIKEYSESLPDNETIDGRKKPTIKSDSELKRIDSYMDMGDYLRFRHKRSDFIALLGIQEIIKKREELPNQNRVYILNSLKTDEEVTTLRKIYGTGFILMGIYSSEENRTAFLEKKERQTQINKNFKNEVRELKKRDEKENDEYGQKVSETFHLADFFVSIDSLDKAEKEIERFLELLFKNPFHTPTIDEYSMYLAYTACLRSSDLSRQVGAAIVTEKGEVVSIGTNDVPCFGGGLYWPSDEDEQRDFQIGYDSNRVEVNNIVKEINENIGDAINKNNSQSGNINKITAENVEKLGKDYDLTEIVSSTLKKISEFGRCVHAEMDAITQAARLGISIKDKCLYTTLFPCHNCTKHIIAAGIKKVIYIEPYSKSMAEDLHKDSISTSTDNRSKIVFTPFEGVGPRLYADLFSLTTHMGYTIERKNSKTGKAKEWTKMEEPRLFLNPKSYLELEEDEISNIINKN